MASKYEYNVANDFLNGKVVIDRLNQEIGESSITTAIDYIASDDITCDIWFKETLSGADATALTTIVALHDGTILEETPAPKMADGRPLVRADTRPLETETYFTCAGDDTGIGDGVHLEWDFSDSTSNMYTGPEVPAGMKAKQLLLAFNCPIYLKDGALYFYDAPWGCYLEMDIIVPNGGYYPNPAGAIPASALGLPGTDMYAQASGNVSYQKYVNRHHIHGSCPMGDEMNAEGAAVNPVPVGWFVRGLIVTHENDNVSKGYGSFEMYRCHTVILPGQTLETLHS